MQRKKESSQQIQARTECNVALVGTRCMMPNAYCFWMTGSMGGGVAFFSGARLDPVVSTVVCVLFRCEVSSRAPAGEPVPHLTRPAARVWRVLGDESAVLDRDGGEFVSRLGHHQSTLKRTSAIWGPRFLFLTPKSDLSRFVPVGESGNPGRSLLYEVG